MQGRSQLNLLSAEGVAVRDAILAPGHGRVDYLLYVGTRAAGVIEAKPAGRSLSGGEWQYAMYATGLSEATRARDHRVGSPPVRVRGQRLRDPLHEWLRSRTPRASTVLLPEAVLAQPDRSGGGSGPRRADVAREGAGHAALGRVRPPTGPGHGGRGRRAGARRAAVRPQPGPDGDGSGKTFTAVTLAYRLLRYGGFGRVLFLVDRNNLADQTLREFRWHLERDDVAVLERGLVAQFLTGEYSVSRFVAHCHEIVKQFDRRRCARQGAAGKGVHPGDLAAGPHAPGRRRTRSGARRVLPRGRPRSNESAPTEERRRGLVEPGYAAHADGVEGRRLHVGHARRYEGGRRQAGGCRHDAADRPRDERTESDRWHSFEYDELIARDKANLDITWLRDESLEDFDNLPASEVIAREIVEDLTAALAEFEAVAAALEARASSGPLR